MNKKILSRFKPTTIIIIVMAVLLLGSGLYVGNDYKKKVLQDAFNKGLGAVYQLTEECKIASISVNGITKQVVDVACITK